MIRLRPFVAAATLSTLSLVGCSAPPTYDTGPAPDAEPATISISGHWRGVLTSPGGELPFGIDLRRDTDGYEAWILNGEERAPTSGVEIDGQRIRLVFDFYDSAIEAEVAPDGQTMFGHWRRTDPGGGLTEMPFLAERGRRDRFEELPVTDDSGTRLQSVAGRWAALFTDEDGTEPVVVELDQEGDGVLGTMLTPTGDYRYLEGVFANDRLRLSTFDGAHAFLFDARVTTDDTLEGRFWSRTSYVATWQAERSSATASVLPDPWSEVRLTNDDGTFRFAFPDLDGAVVSSGDERFQGRPTIVNVFGSWCPNCNDEAPLLAEWDRRHRDQGLQIVGLAYEFTGNAERDARQVRRYAERHGIEYTLLLAGTSDKADASDTLPDITAVRSYPTTIFIGRDGRVRGIHSGFAGPGTGRHHDELVAELEAKLAEILGHAG